MASRDNLTWLDHLPEGWRPLYQRLVADLAAVDAEATVEEAKEKFGMLRVYLDRTDPALGALVLDAERASARMCQTCGEEGILRHSPGEGYHIYATLCDAHRGDYVPAAKDPIVMSLKVSPDGSVREVKRR